MVKVAGALTGLESVKGAGALKALERVKGCRCSHRAREDEGVQVLSQG